MNLHDPCVKRIEQQRDIVLFFDHIHRHSGSLLPKITMHFFSARRSPDECQKYQKASASGYRLEIIWEWSGRRKMHMGLFV